MPLGESREMRYCRAMRCKKMVEGERAGRVERVVLLTLGGWLIGRGDAQAYLDPGTGSMILQAVVAGFLGLAFTLRMYWQKLKDLVSGSSRRADEGPEPSDE